MNGFMRVALAAFALTSAHLILSTALHPAAAAQEEDPAPPRNLLENGSFEEGPEVDRILPLDEDSTAIPGWKVTRGRIGYVASGAAHADGKRSVDLHGGPGFGGIQQTFATIKGEKYRVTFAVACSGEPAQQKIGVRAAGQKTAFTVAAVKSPNELEWTTKTWEFTASGEETTLEFHTLMTAHPDSGPRLDNVRVHWLERDLVVSKNAGRTDEQGLFDSAAEAFNEGSFVLASLRFEQFLQKHPKSKLAAEAVFRISSAKLLDSTKEEAAAQFKKLVENYGDSPWANLALQTMFDEEALWTLAVEKRKQARNGKTEMAEPANKVFAIHEKRFADKRASERAYKMADCTFLAGETKQARAAFRELYDKNSDGTWGKLAGYRICDFKSFQQGMETLVNLEAEDDEQFAVFLDLAKTYANDLPEADQVKCLFLQARCQEGDNKEKARELYAKVAQEHTKTVWAEESLFWLAELDYRDGNHAQARKRFLELAKSYPLSLRTPRAKEWAAWLDDAQATSAELEKVMSTATEKAAEWSKGFAFTLVGQGEKLKHPLEAHIAWRSEESYLARVRYGDTGLVLARSVEGSYYHALEGSRVLHSKNAVKLPAPKLELGANVGTNSLKFSFATMDDKDAKAAIDISPFVGQVLARNMFKTYHVRHIAAKDGKAWTTFLAQEADRKADVQEGIEIVVDDQGLIREVRWLSEDGKTPALVMKDIVLGAEPPEKLLSLDFLNEAKVQDVDQINSVELFAHILRVFAAITNDGYAGFQRASPIQPLPTIQPKEERKDAPCR